MSSQLLHTHPLQDFFDQRINDEDIKPGIDIEVRPFLSYINLRGDVGDKQFIEASSAALGQTLPLKVNSTSSGAHSIFCLGPDEWLIETENNDELVEKLRVHLSSFTNALTNASAGYISFYLSGPRCIDVLAKGCTLDLHARTFLTGQCAQTGLASANILISKLADEPEFNIVVRRSFAEYLALWLQHSAKEFGVKFNYSN